VDRLRLNKTASRNDARLRGPRPSAALLIAIMALVFALAGGATAAR
jgi:hypothetical protein